MRVEIKKLTLMAALTSAALIVFIIEAQIPLPIPVQGAKLGLANTITLFALFYRHSKNRIRLTTADAFMILVCRMILGAVFTGRIVAFAFSVAGGLLAFAAMAVTRRFVTDRQVWVCGAIGAVFHNIGQIGAAMIITGSPAIAALLPLLITAGIITGVITGLAAQFILSALKGDKYAG